MYKINNDPASCLDYLEQLTLHLAVIVDREILLSQKCDTQNGCAHVLHRMNMACLVLA